MNKLPKAIGLGFGLALGTGALLGSANAEASQHAVNETKCHTGYFVVGLGSIVEYPDCTNVTQLSSKTEVMISPANEELSNGLQNNQADYVHALGFLAGGLAGVALVGYGVKKYVTYQVDAIHADLYPVTSEPLPEPADISELVAANRLHAARELESIARTYHIMQNADTTEVDNAWIKLQSMRSDEL